MSGLESVQAEHNHPSSETISRKIRIESQRQSLASDVAAGPAVPTEFRDQAMAQFDEELPPTPNHPAILQRLLRNAELLMKNQDWSLALNILRNVLMREPNQIDALYFSGSCLREKGRLEEAEKYFRAALKINRDQRTLQALADTLYLQGNDNEAFALYHETLASLVSDEKILFDIYKNLGNIHVRAGDFEAAEEAYNKAHTLDGESDILMVNYGTLEIQRENMEAAVTRFRQAVSLNSQNDKAWVGLGLVHRHMGDLELAMANVERALDINPGNKTALNLIVDWGVRDGMLSPALRCLTEFLTVDCEDADASLTLAKTLIYLNRLDEAALELERTLALAPMMEDAVRLMDTVRAEQKKRKMSSQVTM